MRLSKVALCSLGLSFSFTSGTMAGDTDKEIAHPSQPSTLSTNATNIDPATIDLIANVTRRIEDLSTQSATLQIIVHQAAQEGRRTDDLKNACSKMREDFGSTYKTIISQILSDDGAALAEKMSGILASWVEVADNPQTHILESFMLKNIALLIESYMLSINWELFSERTNEKALELKNKYVELHQKATQMAEELNRRGLIISSVNQTCNTLESQLNEARARSLKDSADLDHALAREALLQSEVMKLQEELAKLRGSTV